MSWRKYWQELYLTAMVSVALAIIIAAAVLLSDLTGLSVTAVGVFIAVLGVGFYDQWQDAELAKERVKTRR
jgi:NADH:ubiquinone oxidoreductase subunit 3 (subunit A)